MLFLVFYGQACPWRPVVSLVYRKSSPDMEPESKYFSVEALRCRDVGPVTFALGRGEIACLSGSSGAGKTILLRAIADLEPHTGTVYLDGRACHLTSPPQWRRQVAMLPAESQWWHTLVRDHFIALEPDELLKLAMDPAVINRPVSSLSTGERQRLALLRLLQNRPRILLLDEPTASLDRATSLRVEQLIRDYIVESRASALWVSHHYDQIRRLAAHHFTLRSGKLELYREHADHHA